MVLAGSVKQYCCVQRSGLVFLMGGVLSALRCDVLSNERGVVYKKSLAWCRVEACASNRVMLRRVVHLVVRCTGGREAQGPADKVVMRSTYRMVMYMCEWERRGKLMMDCQDVNGTESCVTFKSSGQEPCSPKNFTDVPFWKFLAEGSGSDGLDGSICPLPPFRDDTQLRPGTPALVPCRVCRPLLSHPGHMFRGSPRLRICISHSAGPPAPQHFCSSTATSVLRPTTNSTATGAKASPCSCKPSACLLLTVWVRRMSRVSGHQFLLLPERCPKHTSTSLAGSLVGRSQ